MYKNFNDRCPKIKPFKTDYKEGDEVTYCLYEIINRFEGQFSVGSNVCFRNLRPADSPTPKGNTDMYKINREKLKNFELNMAKLDVDGINKIMNDLMSMYTGDLMPTDIPEEKKDDDGFVSITAYDVSITAYDMLANAFDAAMDEIKILRAKLKRVQEVIKD